MFDEEKVLQVFRNRYPVYKDKNDTEVLTKLSDPINFKKVFPEYKNWEDKKLFEQIQFGKLVTAEELAKVAKEERYEPLVPWWKRKEMIKPPEFKEIEVKIKEPELPPEQIQITKVTDEIQKNLFLDDNIIESYKKVGLTDKVIQNIAKKENKIYTPKKINIMSEVKKELATKPALLQGLWRSIPILGELLRGKEFAEVEKEHPFQLTVGEMAGGITGALLGAKVLQPYIATKAISPLAQTALSRGGISLTQSGIRGLQDVVMGRNSLSRALKDIGISVGSTWAGMAPEYGIMASNLASRLLNLVSQFGTDVGTSIIGDYFTSPEIFQNIGEGKIKIGDYIKQKGLQNVTGLAFAIADFTKGKNFLEEQKYVKQFQKQEITPKTKEKRVIPGLEREATFITKQGDLLKKSGLSDKQAVRLIQSTEIDGKELRDITKSVLRKELAEPEAIKIIQDLSKQIEPEVVLPGKPGVTITKDLFGNEVSIIEGAKKIKVMPGQPGLYEEKGKPKFKIPTKEPAEIVTISPKGEITTKKLSVAEKDRIMEKFPKKLSLKLKKFHKLVEEKPETLKTYMKKRWGRFSPESIEEAGYNVKEFKEFGLRDIVAASGKGANFVDACESIKQDQILPISPDEPAIDNVVEKLKIPEVKEKLPEELYAEERREKVTPTENKRRFEDEVKIFEDIENAKIRAVQSNDNIEFEKFLDMDNTLKALNKLKKMYPEYTANWNKKYDETSKKIYQSKYAVIGGKPPEVIPESDIVIKKMTKLYAEQKTAIDTLTEVNSFEKWDIDRYLINSEVFKKPEPYSLLTIDIDNLKNMNSTLTEPVVNKHLKEIGKILKEYSYEAYRVTADSFVVSLPNKNIQEAGNIAEEIRRKVEIAWDKFYKEQGSPPIIIERGTEGNIGTVSIGVAEKNIDKATDILNLEIIANNKRHLAKEQGRNKVITELTEFVEQKKAGEVDKAISEGNESEAEKILTDKAPIYFTPPQGIAPEQSREWSNFVDTLPKYILSLNTEKYDYEDDILKDMYFKGLQPYEKEYEGKFPRLRGEAGRNVVKRKCEELGYDLEGLEKVIEKYTKITAPKLIAAIRNSEITLANLRYQVDLKRIKLKELRNQGKEQTDEYYKLFSEVTVSAKETTTLDRIFKTSGAKRITGQTLQSFKETKKILGDMKLSKKDQLQKILNLKFNPDSKEFDRFTQILNTIDEEDPGQLANFLADITTRPNARQHITSYLYSNVLSGPKTQAINFAAVRVYGLFMRKVIHPVAIGYDKIYSWLHDKPRTFTWKALKFSKLGLQRGEEMGQKKFLDICRFGFNPDTMDLNKWEIAYQNKYHLPMWYYEKDPTLRAAYKVQQFPLTLLKAADVWNECRYGTWRLYNDAYVAAENELKAAQAKKDPSIKINEKEVAKLAEDTYIYDEKLIRNSQKFAGTVSMNMKAGKITDWFIKANRQFLPAMIFNPFPKIAGNIARTGLLDLTPVTFFKASATEQEDALRYAKGIVGTAILGLGATMLANGQLILDAPKDPVEKDIFYRQGYKPYSFVIGGICFPIRRIMEQTSYPLFIGAIIAKNIKERIMNKESTESIVAVGTKIAMETGNFISDASYMENVGDIADVMTGRAAGKAKLERVTANFTTAWIPFSSFNRASAQAIDPYIIDEWEKDNPFISIVKQTSATIPSVSLAMRHKISKLTGKEILRPGGRIGGFLPEYILPARIKTETPFEKMIAGFSKHKIHIGEFKSIAGIDLTKDEKNLLNIKYSEILKKMQPSLLTLLDILDKEPDPMNQIEIKENIKSRLRYIGNIVRGQIAPAKQKEKQEKLSQSRKKFKEKLR